MRFFVLTILALIPLALADLVSLKAIKKDNSFLGFLHTVSAGLNVANFMVSEQGTSFKHQNNQIFQKSAEGEVFPICFRKGFLSVTNLSSPINFAFNNDGVMLSTHKFWACNSINSPNHLQLSSKIIIYYRMQPNPSCVEIDIMLHTIARTVLLIATTVDGPHPFSKDLTIISGRNGVHHLAVRGPGSQFIFQDLVISTMTNDHVRYNVGLSDGFLGLGNEIPPYNVEVDADGFFITDLNFWACNNQTQTHEQRNSPSYRYIVYGNQPTDESCMRVRIGIRSLSGNTKGLMSV